MPICAKCNLSIKPAALACTVSGKEFHPTCINCSVCDKRLWGIPFTRTKDGKLVCEKTCSNKPPPMIRSETRTLMRDEDDSETKPIDQFSQPVNSNSPIKLKNFNPQSFESQLNLDLTPRINNAKTKLDKLPPAPAETFNQSKICKSCDQSVFKKRFITFENGEIMCHDCDLKTQAKPARVKSAHLIICSNCDKTVRGTRYITESNGNIVCEKCELTGNRCSKCGLLLQITENQRLLSNGERLHNDCFNCDKCDSLIETEDFYETKSGRPMCLSCYESSRLPKCSKCTNYISGPFKIIENQPIHADCFKCVECGLFLNTETGYFKNDNNELICPNCNLKQNAAKCSKCSERIIREGVSFANKDYHQLCFKCDLCQIDLLKMKQILTDKQNQGIFCITCFVRNFSPNCDKCRGPIAPHQIATKYEEKNFHRECFCCARCKKTLANKKFFKAGNILICEDCF